MQLFQDQHEFGFQWQLSQSGNAVKYELCIEYSLSIGVIDVATTDALLPADDSFEVNCDAFDVESHEISVEAPEDIAWARATPSGGVAVSPINSQLFAIIDAPAMIAAFPTQPEVESINARLALAEGGGAVNVVVIVHSVDVALVTTVFEATMSNDASRDNDLELDSGSSLGARWSSASSISSSSVSS